MTSSSAQVGGIISQSAGVPSSHGSLTHLFGGGGGQPIAAHVAPISQTPLGQSASVSHSFIGTQEPPSGPSTHVGRWLWCGRPAWSRSASACASPRLWMM